MSTPSSKWAHVNGVRLHYREWDGGGRSLVLVHGLASTTHIWDLIAPLLARNFRVIAVDQRGHGESDRPEGGYDFGTVSTDLCAFIESLGVGAPVVVGHSWGGNVALEMAYRQPEAVGGLCLLDGGFIELATEMTLEQALAELAPPDFSGMPADKFRQMVREYDHGFSISPAIEDAIFANFEVLPDGTVASRLRRDRHLAIISAMWHQRPSAMYAAIRCPVLLMPARRIVAAGDPAFERVRKWKARWDRWVATAERLLPASATAYLEDSVHDVPWQHPVRVAETIGARLTGAYFDQRPKRQGR